MRKPFWVVALTLLIGLWSGLDAERLNAQGVTTSAIIGTVTDVSGAPLPGFQVVITNTAISFLACSRAAPIPSGSRGSATRRRSVRGSPWR